jgi:hypothetical protein
MQSLEYQLGAHLAARYCAPLAFYMLLRAAGYLPKSLMPGPFCQELDKGELRTTNADWSRPALSRILRRAYKAPIVSWSFHYPDPNIEAMVASGYLESQQEIDFYLNHVRDHSVEELVRAGYPVIVTVRAGFGSDENQNIHAVVLAKWDDEGVTVFDPDARNTTTVFSAERIGSFLLPNGAGSIVLPRH